MPAQSKSVAILAAALLAACAPAPSTPPAAPAPAPAPAAQPHNVILIIGDGAGIAHWSAGKLLHDLPAVRQMPVVGLVDTRGTDFPKITDSAAGGTAYAAGTRTFNGAIGVGPGCKTLLQRDSAAAWTNPAQCDPLESVFDVARRRGMAVGVVTTAEVTDATPAVFLAHAPSRRMMPQIAEQMLAERPEVVLGGGRRFFDGSARPDSANLLTAYCARAACLATPAELEAYRPDERPLLGLFTPAGLPLARERQPSLEAMARAGLARLARNPRGFMVMIENGGTDAVGHANAPLQQVADEALVLDRTIAIALDFARRDGRTLVVVTADHETGGLAITEKDGASLAGYVTRGHSGAMVPLFAYGPGGERFAGIRDNEEVGRLLREMVGG